MSLRVNRYLSHSNDTYTYSVEQFKNGKHDHLGLFDEKSFTQFIKRSRFKKYTLVNVAQKRDLFPSEVVL